MKIGFFGTLESDKKDYYSTSLAGSDIVFIDSNLNEENIPQIVDFDIISVFARSKVTSRVIDGFHNLKMISVRATGFDNVDINYAQSKNIAVSTVPGYGAHTVAEFTFGLILSLTRRIPQAITKLKSELNFNTVGLRGFDLYGKTLGVIGTGKIGASVIKIAKSFGMSVLAVDTYPNEQLIALGECKYVSLNELLNTSDIVTIHVPANSTTRHMINKDNIFEMKKGALLINTARGDVVETEALYKAIFDGHLLGAGLDVLENESDLNESGKFLINNPSVIVTPHTAFYTIEAEASIMQITAENILGFIQGSPKNIVNL